MRFVFRSFWAWLVQRFGLRVPEQNLDRQQSLMAQDQKIQYAEKELDVLHRELDTQKRKINTISETHLRLQHARRIDVLNQKITLKNAQINQLVRVVRVLRGAADLEDLATPGGVLLPTAEETLDRVARVQEKTRDLIESATLLDEGLTGIYETMECQTEQQRLDEILADSISADKSSVDCPAPGQPASEVSTVLASMAMAGDTSCGQFHSLATIKRPLTA